jgi:hypothetical protein
MFRDSMTTTDTNRLGSEPSVTQLVSGIVDDAQELLRQQIILLKHEVRRDLKDATQMSISFVACCLLGGIAALLVSFMIVQLVSLVIPLWISFAVVGCAYGFIAVVMFFYARQKFEDIAPPISDEAREALKENLQWTRKPK